MSRKAVFIVVVIIAVITIGGLLKDWLFSGDNSKIYYLGIWKNTPAWNLALAVKHQNVKQIEKIAKSRPEGLNYQEQKFGATLLIWAVGMEKYKSAEALLKCGADPNIATAHAGETALFVAAGYSWVDYRFKKDPKYVKLLLKYGADPNFNYVGFGTTADGARDITESGTSPLMHSIGCGIEKTKALVEGGADINYKTASGRTVAIKALIAGAINVPEEQLEYAYYLIALKRAKVTDPYYRGELFTMPGDDPKEKFYPVNILRDWIPDLNSKGHRMKMAIVKEFARQGVDYHKTKISDERLRQIKKLYPDTWQEYIKNY